MPPGTSGRRTKAKGKRPGRVRRTQTPAEEEVSPPNWDSIAETWVQEHLKEQSLAEEAAASFPAFLRLCGRNKNGQLLRLDPQHLDDAAVLERAYFEGKNIWTERPRGSLKSTLIVAFMAWMIGRDPQLTILYTSDRDGEAKRRNNWMLGIMSTKDFLRAFGEKAQPFRPKCSAEKTTVRGKRDRSDANVQVFGILGVRAGEHYDIAIVDDVCDTRSSHIQPATKKAIRVMYRQQVEAQVNPKTMAQGRLGVGLIFGQGTTYADDDLNAELAKAAEESQSKGGSWLYHRVAVTINLTEGGAEIITPYPTVLPIEPYLRERWESSERAFRMNYMLEPVGADEKPFASIHFYLPENWVKNAKEWNVWEEQTAAFGYEPGMLPAQEREPDTAKWFRCMAVDPGFSEKRNASCTGICIGALAPTGDIYILRASKFRQRWEKTVKAIPEMYQKYACDLCLFEVAGQQDAAFYSLEKELKAECGVARIATVSPNNQSKLARAQFIGPRVNNGRVLLAGRVIGNPPRKLRPTQTSQALHEDLLACPANEETDLVDAFVYLVTELRGRAVQAEKTQPMPKSQEEQEKARIREGINAMLFPDKNRRSGKASDVSLLLETNAGGTPWN